MAEQIIYNNYSKKLLEHFPKPSLKEPLRFQLLNIRWDPIVKKHILPQTSGIDPVDRIYDPWAVEIKDAKGNVTGYEGREINIAYITAERPSPAGSNLPTQIITGEILFLRETVGRIEYSGNDKAKERMAVFLYFSNRNESNKGKPWHITPRFNNYIYQIHSKSGEAKEKLAKDRLIDKANAVIDKFSIEELEKFRKGLFPKEAAVITDDEVINKLRAIATTSPDKILNLSKDVDVAVNASIMDWEAANLIEFDAGKKMWVWPDTKQRLCQVKPGQTKFSCLKTFLITTEGAEVVKLLEDLHTAHKAKETEGLSNTLNGGSKDGGIKDPNPASQPPVPTGAPS